jgi:hypothetical protein
VRGARIATTTEPGGRRMSGTDFRRDPGEAAVTQPDLAVLCDLARAQRVPTVRIETPTLIAAVAQRRATRLRWTAAGGLLAVAAAWVLWTAIDRRAWVASDEATRDEAPRVLDGSRDGGQAHDVVPAAPDRAVVHETPPAEPAPIVEDVPPVPPAPDAKPTEPAGVVQTMDAGGLARLAENAMAARRRDEAIALLSTLVRRFPKAPQAKAALLDLGRLLRDGGRNDEARCAYQLLVQRWPSEAKTPEITRVLGSLGDGPKCRGLKPQR